MQYNRDTTWTTHLGKEVKVRDMENSHLTNLIRFLERYSYHPASRRMLPVLREEMKIRGLKMPEFQIPYHDGKGNMIIWDFQQGGPKVIGKYVPSLWERIKTFVKRSWEATLKGSAAMHDDF